jgi:hypothetical protein
MGCLRVCLAGPTRWSLVESVEALVESVEAVEVTVRGRVSTGGGSTGI